MICSKTIVHAYGWYYSHYASDLFSMYVVRTQVKRRVVLLGCPGSGKTSLIQRFVESTFDNAYYPTISQTFRSVTHEGEKMFTIEILDMAGLVSSIAARFDFFHFHVTAFR